ncbi:MAG: pilus (MSHA type) biogenesis protein MshL [Thiobacillus sp.]|nr:pilus (MSHA type) biogenesis protein MshL [Thiobacillus sp.]
MNKQPGIWIVYPLILAGCAGPLTPRSTQQAIQQEVAQAARPQPAASQMTDEQARVALMPAPKLELPRTAAEPIEQRFDLSVKNAPAQDVFMAIVSGTRYSMLVHPEVAGTISANLKNVTVPEALTAIRELYGYDYSIEGRRVIVQPLTAQTRIFKVNYLAGTRSGASDTRVISGSVSTSSNGTAGGGGGTTQSALETSKITSAHNADFWGELKVALETIVGDTGKVILSPQSGVVVVKATPRVMHDVERFLKATSLAVERQVMLEAKILEVRLNDGFQTGINWSVLKNGQHKYSAGANTSNFDLLTGAATGSLGEVLGGGLPAAAGTTSGLFGLAFQTRSFAALINFLETQGSVHVLSSPRIAALNNQKSVLKVGTDDFFVTEVSTTSNTGGAGTTTTPSVTLQPFFSGISLDVTPQIDEKGRIFLHVRPSVSVVTEKIKNIDVGTAGGRLALPLASSSVSETDSVVQVEDGRIVAIGGMMKQSFDGSANKVPGLGSVPVLGYFFGNTNQTSVKSELVILIKPTVINSHDDWQADAEATRARIEKIDRRPVTP